MAAWRRPPACRIIMAAWQRLQQPLRPLLQQQQWRQQQLQG